MSKRRISLFALLVLPLLLWGCKVNTINSFPSNPAHVRSVNLLADVPVINVGVNDTTPWTGLTIGSFTPYEDFDNKRTTFSVTAPGATSPISQADFNLAGQQSFTVVAYGLLSSPVLALLADDTSTAPPNNFNLRFINFAVTAGPIDLYLTAPGVDISTVGATSINLFYGSATNARSFATGTYQIRATQGGTLNIIYDSGPITFNDQGLTNLFFYTRNSGLLVNAAFVPINAQGTSGIVDNLLARVKPINGAFDAGTVNVLENGVSFYTQIPYPAAGAYINSLTGARTLTFEPDALPGATIATLPVQLNPATDTSVVVMGRAGATTAFALNDDNLFPSPDNVKVRFVNATPDVPSVNAVVSGTTRGTAIASGTASPYVEFGGGTYDVTFTDANTGATLLTVGGIGFSNGQIVSIYLVGPAGALQGIVTQDR